MAREIIQDSAEVSFTIEEAIVSDTVKVTISANLAGKAEDTTDVRTQITTALKGVLDVEWAFTKLDRREDSSGLERVSATATARIPEGQVAGLASKARAASVAGLKLTVGSVDYSPAASKVEEVIKGLRRKLYALAQEEANILQETAGQDASGKWRVNSVSFAPQAYNSPFNVARSYSGNVTASLEAAGGGAPEGLDLTQKVSLTAQVTLARVVLG